MKEAANDDNAGELSLNITDAVQVTATAQQLQCYALSAVARGWLYSFTLPAAVHKTGIVTVLRRGEQNYKHLQQVSSDDRCQVLLKSVDIIFITPKAAHHIIQS